MRLYEIDKSIIDLDKLCCITVNDTLYYPALILNFGSGNLSISFKDKNLLYKKFEEVSNAWKQEENKV